MNLETVTYQEVINGYIPEGDHYGLAAYALAEPRLTAFLSNPRLNDKSKVMLKLVREDGKIVGRSMQFPSRFKAESKIIDTVGGSALEVADDYRSSDAGMLLMSYNLEHKENNATILSGFSRVAARCHKAMGSRMFTFPQLVQIRNFTKILPVLGIPQWVSKYFGWLGTCFIYPFCLFANIKGKRLKKKYNVEKVEIVPDWVDDIVLNDGHDYMEIHDHQWLQWNLNNMFHSHPLNRNSFYTVTLDGEGLGFFMIKERFNSIETRGVKNALFGTVVEWGTKTPDRLNEYQLQLMALASFSKRVDLVYTATTDEQVVKRLKKLFLIKMRDAEIAFKDLKKQFKESKDIKKWRLRLGYGDTILN